MIQTIITFSCLLKSLSFKRTKALSQTHVGGRRPESLQSLPLLLTDAIELEILTSPILLVWT